jgi:hypothetical protein
MGVMLVLGRRWRLVLCVATLSPQKFFFRNFTCVFNSVESPYCASNLRQISLGPTFSLARNFITTRCATVIGTALSLILIPTNCGEGRVQLRVEEGLHTPPQHRSGSLSNRAHRLVATDRGRFIFDPPTYHGSSGLNCITILCHLSVGTPHSPQCTVHCTV